MKETLLQETRIGDVLTIGAEMEGDEIGFFLASADVSASCGFMVEEWDRFVEGVNTANERLKILTK